MILAATPWPTNADLIADCARLGYLTDTDFIYDSTYGVGNWWTAWKSPLGIARSPDDDFTAMPYKDNCFDVVTFDPPYVSPGGRRTSNIKDFHRAYGMAETPTTPLGVQSQINLGLTECQRVVKPNGIVLVKCMNYISSGKLFLGAYLTLNHALSLDFEVIDWFEMIRKGTPQSQTRQVHARRNLSTLYVLKKRPCSSCHQWGHYSSNCHTHEPLNDNELFDSILEDG